MFNDQLGELFPVGYRRLHVLLRREGEPSGLNRIYRLYREEGFDRALKQMKPLRVSIIGMGAPDRQLPFFSAICASTSGRAPKVP